MIGLPGDTIEVKDGAVWVNGTKLDEPYTYDLQPTTAAQEPATLDRPERPAVRDGRSPRGVGGFPRPSARSRSARVIGRAWLRYWPLSTFGILQTPTYPAPVGNGDASPSPAVP